MNVKKQLQLNKRPYNIYFFIPAIKSIAGIKFKCYEYVWCVIF